MCTNINHYLGLAEYQYRQKTQSQPVRYEPAKLINGHMLLCGMSGTGKSFQSMRFLESAVQAGVEVDIWDAHEELDRVPGTVACKYSQATRYGYNPLVLDTNIHSGGVDRQVSFVVNLVKEITPQFGARQEAALRYLLTDVYAAAGIRQKDAWTWKKKQITEEQHAKLIETRQWKELREYYPTLEDVKSYAKRKIIGLTIGGDMKAAVAFEQLCRQNSRLTGLLNKAVRGGTDDEVDKLKGQIAEQKEKCKGTYGEFVDSIQTGREIDDILKYDSAEVLSSVLQRLDLINSTGILYPNEPPFGDALARVHQIKDLQDEQQVMLVKMRLRAVFNYWKSVGPTESGTEIRHVIFLDEGHKYFSKDENDIINVIAKEGRKFGIALWCASQSPTVFPESFLTNCGATVLLGIHSKFWKQCISMLRLTEDTLKYIKAKEVLSIKMQKDGQPDPAFINIIVPNPATEAGQTAARLSRSGSGG